MIAVREKRSYVAMSKRLITCLSVLCAVAALAEGLPPPGYVLFSQGETTLGMSTKVLSGDVGSNAVPGGVTLKRRATTAAGCTIRANVVVLESRVEVSNVDTNDLQADVSASVAGVVATPLTMPVAAEVPNVPAFEPGTEDVTVRAGASRELTPGAYREIVVDGTGSLALASGTYHIASLAVGPTGELRIAGSVRLFVSATLALDALARVNQQAPLQRLGIYVAGTETVNIKDRACVSALIVAPNAGVALSSKVLFQGQLFAQAISTGIGTNLAFRELDPDTAPEITITGVTDGLVAKEPVTPVIEVTGTERGATTITLNNTPFVSGTTISDDGDYTLLVRVELDNGEAFEEVQHFALDRAAPVITVTGVAEGATAPPPVVPEVQVVDPHLADFTVTLNGNPLPPGTAIIKAGNYELVVEASDAAGHTSRETVRFAVAEATTAAPLESFSLFAQESLRVGSNAFIREGRIGTNGRESGSLMFLSGGQTGSDVEVFGDVLYLRKHVFVGQAYYNSIQKDPKATIGQAHSPTIVPIASVFPAIPDFAAGSKSLSIRSGKTVTVQPGKYSSIKIGGQAVVTFAPGEYFAQKLVAAGDCELRFTGATDFYLDRQFQLGPEARFNCQTGDPGVHVSVRGRGQILFDDTSTVRGTFFAPDGFINIGEDVLFSGKGWANWLIVGPKATTLRSDEAPPITEATPVGGVYPDTQQVSLTPDEPATIRYTVDGSSPTDASSVYQQPLQIAADTVLSFVAVDRFGNQSVARQVQYFIDPDAPVITVTGIDDGTVTRDGVTPQITITDRFIEESATTLGGEPFISGTVINAEGAYELAVSATDKAGRTAAVTIHFAIDRTAPVITVTGVADGTITDEDVTVEVAVADANQDTSSITLDGNPFTSGTTVSAEGPHVLRVSATDGAGNQASRELRFTIDKTPPGIQITGVAEGDFRRDTVTPEITFTDTNLDPEAPGETLLDQTPFVSGTPVIGEGVHILTASVTDLAGRTTTVTLDFVIDKTAPEIDVVGVDDGDFSNQDITLVVRIRDANPDTSTVTLNGAAYESGTAVTGEGAYTLAVSATDKAGNQGGRQVAFAIDKTVPVLIVSSPDREFRTKEAVFSLTGTVDDAHFEGLVITQGRDEQVVATQTGSFDTSISLVHEGLNVLQLVARDALGHIATQEFRITRDTTPPALTINTPADGTRVSTTPLAAAGQVDDPTATVTINTGAPLTVTDGAFAADLELQEGSNTFVFRAEDDLENASEVEITVILDTQAPAIELTNPPPDFATRDAQLSVQGTCPDPEATVRVNGAIAPLGDSGAFAVPLELAVGSNEITITAQDETGNVSTVQRTVVRDITAPALTVTAPANGLVTNAPSVMVTGTVDDEAATVSVNGADALVTNGAFEFQVTLPEDSGPVTITVTAQDPVGNTRTEQRALARDITPPQITFLSPSADSTLAATRVTLVGSIDDPEGTVLVNGTLATVNGDRFALSDVDLAEGANVFTAAATDALGNPSTVIQMTLNLDTTPPALPTLQDVPAFVKTARVALSGTTEPNATVRVSGGIAVVTGTVDGAGAFALDILLEADQANDLAVTAADPVGNVSDPARHTVTSDTTSPTIAMSAPESGWISPIQSVAVVGQATDANAIESVSVDGQPAEVGADGTFYRVISLANGDHTASVIATDAAGNTAEASLTFSVDDDGVDGEGPIITVVSPPPGASVPAIDVPVTAVILDASDIAEVKVNDVVLDPLGDYLTGDVLEVTARVNENGEFAISATDEWGNEGTTQRELDVDVEAPDAPVVEGPSDGTRLKDEEVVVVGSAEASATVVIRNGTRMVTAQADENGVFAIGVLLDRNQNNTLSVTALDSAGNESDTTTVEVVHDDQPPRLDSTTPADKATGVALDTTVTLAFSEPVHTETLGNYLALSVGASPKTFTIVLQNGNREVALFPTEPFADSDRVSLLVGGEITDVAGNALGDSRTVTFRAVDLTAPAAPVIDTLPGRVREQDFSVTGTAEADATITVVGGQEQRQGVAGGDGRFTVSVPLNADQENTLAVTATDVDMNTSGAAEVQVTHDGQSPQLTGSTPQDGAEGVSVTADLLLNFDEPLADDAPAYLSTANPGLTVIAWEVSPGGTQITGTVNGSLNGSTVHTVMVPDGITDLVGNPLSQQYTVSFTTVDNVAPDYPRSVTVTPASPTNSIHGTVAGYAEPGSTLRITGGAETVEHAVDTTGLFSVPVPLKADLVNTLHLVAVDAQGNVSAVVTKTITQDGTIPAVIRTDPAEGDVITPAQSVLVEFSEAMNTELLMATTSPVVVVQDVQHQSVPGQLALSSSAKAVTFYPTHKFTPGAAYGFLIKRHAQDLAGNTLATDVTINFTVTEMTARDKAPAPVLDPVPETVLTETVRLTGTATANTTLHVLGGALEVTAAVQEDETFSVSVPLIAGETHQLACFVRFDGVDGAVATATVTQQARPTGIRIVTPVEGVTYPNRSVTVMGIIDDPPNVKTVSVDGEKAAVMGIYFVKQVLFEAEGQHTVTVTAELNNGEIITKTVTFTYESHTAEDDTLAPIVKILFPEAGVRMRATIVDVMGTVEEGGLLASVNVEGVPAHSLVGNIFFVFAELREQGENTITVNALDRAANQGGDSVTLYLDSLPPPPPAIDELPTLTDRRVVQVTGTAEPGVRVQVIGGLVDAFAYAGEDGKFTVHVPLSPNQANALQVSTVDDAGNTSAALDINITHDDLAPYVVATSPTDAADGVPINQQVVITFSEPMNGATIRPGDTIRLTNADGDNVPGNVILSADRARITYVQAAKFQRSDTITVTIAPTVADANGYTLGETFVFAFNTAEYKTTFSGVVVDPDLRPLEYVTVGIADSDLTMKSSAFGTFLLDDVPLGEQVLFVDGTQRGEDLPEDNRLFGRIEIPVSIVADTDNSLGRPLFLVPTDLNTMTPTVPEGATVTFEDEASDLDGFTITYGPDAARFGDGTATGVLTATRIQPAFIPDRLPDGAIPHFIVEIGPDGLSFDPPASLTFPNVYELGAGEKVRVFAFRYGMNSYEDLGEAAVAEDGTITAEGMLAGSGFVGIVPADGSHLLAKNYLRGRVVGTDGRGIPNVRVNAIAGSAVAVTDADGNYVITMPEVRIFLIRTFATVPTSLGEGEDGNPALVFQSALAELRPSGVTEMPDIVVDTFFLGGSIRYVDEDGGKVPRTGRAYVDGALVSTDDAMANNVRIYLYRRLPDTRTATDAWEQTTYAQARAGLDPLELGFDAAFTIPIVGEADTGNNTASASAGIRPGDWIRIVAFDPATGWYGETDLQVPSLADRGQNPAAGLDVLTNVDLRPPLVDLDLSRVFYLDGVRRRANIPNQGIALTNDEYVEIRALWRTPATVPLTRSKINLKARLLVDSIGYQDDIFFSLYGGEHARVLEIREALYPDRLAVLQRETDVGTETITISPDGSFAEKRLLPVMVRTSSYGLPVEGDVSPLASQEVTISIIELNLEQAGEGGDIEGRAKPGTEITIGGIDLVAGADGRFSGTIDTLTEGGVLCQVGGGPAVLVGAAYTPILESLTPNRGSQGDVVTIVGQHFGALPTDNKVKFSGAPARVLSATETEIRAEVPQEASSGPVTVTVGGRTSNGLAFDFISDGINNGSFEKGSLHGFSYSGDVEVRRRLLGAAPTHGDYMVYMNTNRDPRDGKAILTSDRFYASAVLKYIVFDLHLMGTAMFRGFGEYLTVSILKGEGAAMTESVVGDVIPADQEKIHAANITGFELGSGTVTVAVDSSPFAAAGEPIQVRFTLHGRGALPSYRAGLRADDDNPLDLGRTQGTGLLLDNVRIEETADLPLPPAEGSISVSEPANNISTVSGQAGTVTPEATVYVQSLQTGQLTTVRAGADGAFQLDVPVLEEVTTVYVLSYSTKRTTTDNTSDRLFSSARIFEIRSN